MIKVSFIIPARDSAATLAMCIRAIRAQKPAPQMEIIVVDNGSKDATAKIAKEAGAKALYLGVPNRGLARNFGASQASGSLLAFIDSDCVIPRNWFAIMRKKLLSDSRLAAVGGSMRLPNSDQPENLGDTVHENRLFLMTGALLARREAFEKVRGFDPWFAYSEDIDLSWRWLEEGYRIAFVTGVITRHHTKDRIADVFKKGLLKGYYEALLRKRWKNQLGTRLSSDAVWIAHLLVDSLAPNSKRTAAFLSGRVLGFSSGLVIARTQPSEAKAQGHLSPGVAVYEYGDELIVSAARLKRPLRINAVSAELLEHLRTRKLSRQGSVSKFAESISIKYEVQYRTALRDAQAWVAKARELGLVNES